MAAVAGRTLMRVIALAGVSTLALSACTSPTLPSGSQTTGSTPSISVAPGSLVYRYVNEGLTATMVLHGRSGTLQIDNRTGHGVGKPGFYVLDAVDGHQVDGSVTDPSALPNGADRTFHVTLGNIDPKDIGLLVLLMGRDNYGAFVEQRGSAAASPSP
jgi:hypothetical protein